MSDKMITPVDMTRQIENEESVNPDDIEKYQKEFKRFADHIIGEHPDETAKRREMEKNQSK